LDLKVGDDYGYASHDVVQIKC